MFLQIDNELHNISGIGKISFSEYPNYEGEWKADLYFYGDEEATLTLPHTFPSEAMAIAYAAAAIGHASLVGACTEEDLISLAAQIEDGPQARSSVSG